MYKTLDFVRKGKNKIVYRAKEPKILTDKLIAEVKWPSKLQTLEIIFDKDVRDIHEILQKNISCKYIVRLVYSVAKGKLILPQLGPINRGVLLKPVVNSRDLKSLFIKTQTMFFIAPWAEYLDHQYFSDTANFIRDDLQLSKSVCFIKNTKHIGLLNILPLDGKTDLVAWVWIDKELPLKDREIVHYKLVEWLQRSQAENIIGVVHSFNIRSNWFFRKIGFVPTCIQITRNF